MDDLEIRLSDTPVFVRINVISARMVDLINDLNLVVVSLKTKLLCKDLSTSRRGVFYA
jgi:hypothetical protein